MKLYVYSVYDQVADVFGTPFFSQSDQVARRSFKMLCEDNNSIVSRNLTDFTLTLIGEFDDSTGSIGPLHPAKIICKASDFANKGEIA